MQELYHQGLPTTKVCYSCVPPTEKLLDEFYKSKGSRDGHQSICKACSLARMKQQKLDRIRQREEHPEHFVLPEKKKCSACQEMKAIDEFGFDKYRPDGREIRCKDCLSKQNHAHYAVNPEHKRELKRQDHQRHREERNAKSRLASHQYHAEHPEKARERRQKWEQEKPEMRRAKWRRYDDRKKAATIEGVDYNRILERDGMWCYICEQDIDPTISSKEPAGLTFDHMIPFTRGGLHCESNVKPAHLVCNDRKGTRLLEEMEPYQRRGMA